MNTYTLVLFLHLVGMASLFMGYGLEWAVSTLLRGATTAGEARGWLRIYRGSLPVSGPGLLLSILTGGYMAGVARLGAAGWIIAAWIGIAVALLIGFALLLPRMKKLRAALPEGNAALGGDALARVQDRVITTLIRARAVLALGIVFLMAAKPAELTTSLIVLVVALALGALCAAGSWSRGPAKS
jgi:hypothetical protein